MDGPVAQVESPLPDRLVAPINSQLPFVPLICGPPESP